MPTSPVSYYHVIISIFALLVAIRCVRWYLSYRRKARFEQWKAERLRWSEALGHEAARALHDDRHPTTSGLVRADRDWMQAGILENLWERHGLHGIGARSGIVVWSEDRPPYNRPIEARIDAILSASPGQLPDELADPLPHVSWSPSGHWSPPKGVVVSVAMARVMDESSAVGRDEWWALQGDRLVRGGPDVGWHTVAPAPPGLEPDRGGFLAHDPGRGVVAYWQCGWAELPGQTFTLDVRALASSSEAHWQVVTHEYRSEDEYGGVRLIFDVARQTLVRHGITYSAVYDAASDAWQEEPAGLVQLALTGTYHRWLVVDQALGQTLVLDLMNRRIVRAAPRGWALVGTLSWPDDQALDIKAFPDHFAMHRRPLAFRYDPVSRHLLFDGVYERGRYRLDLGPALARAASLEPVGSGDTGEGRGKDED